METSVRFDPELARRYDVPGPRYTSYPTAPQFDPAFGAADYRRAAQHSNEDPIPSALSLYVHVPFCTSPCFHCGCNRVITRDASAGALYLLRLQREIEMQSALFDRDRVVEQLHLGGGTPSFLPVLKLAELMSSLERAFTLCDTEAREFSIELDPRTVSDCNAVALDTAIVCELPYARVSELARQVPGLQHTMFRLMSKDLSQSHVLAGDLTAEERIAGFLMSLSSRLKARGYSDSHLTLAMPRRDIANYLRLATETVSRVFTRFEKDGLIAVERRDIRLLDLAFGRAGELRSVNGAPSKARVSSGPGPRRAPLRGCS